MKNQNLSNYDALQKKLKLLNQNERGLWNPCILLQFFNFVLELDLKAVLSRMDAAYDEIHENYKIGAVFMDHYTNGVTSPKFYINTILNEILKSLQFKVFESSEFDP